MGSDASGGSRRLATVEMMQELGRTLASAPRRADAAGSLPGGRIAMSKRVTVPTIDKTAGEMALQGFTDHGNQCAPQKLVQLVGYRDPNGAIARVNAGRLAPKE